MDVERIIDEIEQLQEMFEAPDIRPLSTSDISAANRRHDEMLAHSPWFRLWQQYWVCSRADYPHSPPVSFDTHSLLEVWWITDFPNETCAASVRRKHEGISVSQGYASQSVILPSKTIDIYVVENDETVHGRTVRAGDEGWFGRRSTPRRGVDSQGRPLGRSFIAVSPPLPIVLLRRQQRIAAAGRAQSDRRVCMH